MQRVHTLFLFCLALVSGTTKGADKVWIGLQTPGLAWHKNKNSTINLDYDGYIAVSKTVKDLFLASKEVLGYSVINQEIYLLIDDNQLDKFKNDFKYLYHVSENTDNEILTNEEVLPELKELNLLQKNQASLSFADYEKKNLTGSGITIAVFDAGFPGVDTHPAFAKLRQRNGIKATRNFLNGGSDVYKKNWHGQAVLSCIAGETESGEKLGLAPEATILLALTEWSVREPFREEIHWQMASEWAIEQGADIISSSLGYGEKRYRLEELNGYVSLVGRAASQAAARGVLVVNSAGNEGDTPWKTLVTPADNDSVLCVGGYNPNSLFAISFTSRGPSRGKHVKPNVVAPGEVMAAKGKGYSKVSGTSFSCPLVAGIAACFLQEYPELKGKPLKAIQKIEAMSDLYPYFDYAHGYGIPHITPQEKVKEVSLNARIRESDTLFLEFTDSSNTKSNQRLYLSILNEQKQILRYQALEVYETNSSFQIPINEPGASFIRLFYNRELTELPILSKK